MSGATTRLLWFFLLSVSIHSCLCSFASVFLETVYKKITCSSSSSAFRRKTENVWLVSFYFLVPFCRTDYIVCIALYFLCFSFGFYRLYVYSFSNYYELILFFHFLPMCLPSIWSVRLSNKVSFVICMFVTLYCYF